MTTNREIITPNLTINPNDRGEISILATALQAESFGAITRREAIERARAILVARCSTEHRLLAAAWVRYNSRSGRASERQIAKVMWQLNTTDLRRMTAERNIQVEAA